MAKQPRILAGETAAITGGARGIGRATAEAFLRQGMRVAIGDVDLDAAPPDGRGARRRAPWRCRSTSPTATSFAAFLDGAEEQLGPLDVLVNNAGIMQIGRFIDEDDLTARRMIDINLHGVILGTKLALERMIPRDRGHIVNISSQAGKFGAPGGATYSATKHAVVGLTEAVRGELRLMGAHVDVSYVMPSVVNTELGLGPRRGARAAQPRAERSRRRDRRRAPERRSWTCGCRSPPSAPTALDLAAAAPAVGGNGARDEGRPRAGGRRREHAHGIRAARLALGAGARAAPPSTPELTPASGD